MHYRKLLIVLAINSVIMFALTYSMIDELSHFRVNINRAYMAILMAAPMGIMMLISMRSMFENRKVNALLFTLFAAVFVITVVLIRKQAPVGDDQFLKSMIPHHSGAILMCEESAISEPKSATLCEKIVRAQKEEIAQMERILERRER